MPHKDHLWSVAAEGAFLGSCLLSPGDAAQVLDEAHEEWFYEPKHKLILRALKHRAKTEYAWDLVVIRETLISLDLLDAAGGVTYLVKLGESTPTSANVHYYAEIIKDYYQRRQLEKTGKRIIDLANEPGSLPEKFTNAANWIRALEQESSGGDIVYVGHTIDAVDFAQETFVSTGFRCIDDTIYGLGKGDIVLVAGRPSSGKSCLLLNIATNMAGTNKTVALFSLEMTARQLQQRMLCTLARVDLKQALKNELNEAQEHDLKLAKQWIREHKLLIDDHPYLTPDLLRAKLHRLTRRAPIDAVFVDYLQLMQNPKFNKIYEKTSDISRQLKIMAQEFQVPIVMAAQLNRKPDDREDGRPRMSDLRDSGALEQDADIVMLLHRKDLECAVKTGHTDLIIDKNRRGETGTKPLIFLGPHTVFIEP